MNKKRLNKISIFGFKSFADNTDIAFSEGVTGIVGPNGCGKSNIAEAFLWVLGEQSARTLRAGSMQEVIFAGSSTRKPLHLAEVTISFSNHDNFLPTPYEEVAVTRKLYRDGESVYLLNNNAVRLKDIHNLFIHSGVSKEAFAIIGQGKVEEIIRQSPHERRAAFEEASEILHFLQERTKAKNKLQSSDSELQRVHDIYQEIEKQLHTLEKQAKAALKFKKMQEEFSELEKALFWKRSLALLQNKETLQQKLEECDRAHKTIIQTIAQTEESVTLYKNRAKRIHHDLETAKEEREKLRNVKDREEQERTQRQERRALLQKKVQKCLEEEKNYELKKINLIQAQKEVATRLEQSKQALEEAKKSYTLKLTQFQECEKASETIIQTQKEFTRKRFTEQTTLHQTESHLKKQELDCLLIKEKIAHKQKILDEIEKECAASQKEEEEKSALHTNLIQEIARQKEAITTIKQELSILETNYKAGQARIEKLKKEELEAATQYRLLNELKENFSGFTQGARTLLAEAKKTTSPLHQKIRPLAELLTGTSQELVILERFYASTLVVQKEADLELVIETAQKNTVQEFSALILERIDPSCTFDNAEKFLSSHFLASYSRKSPHAFFDNNKVFFWGTKEEATLFVREKKLQSYKAQEKECSTAIASEESLLKTLNEQSIPLKTSLSAQEDALRKNEFILTELHKALQKITVLRQTKKSEKERSLQELTSLQETIVYKETEIDQTRALHSKLLTSFTQSENAFHTCEEEMKKALAQLKTLQAEKEALFTKQDSLRALLQKEEHQHEILLLKEKEEEAHIHRTIQERNEAMAEDSTLASQITDSSHTVTTADQSLVTIEEKIAQIQSALEEIEQESTTHELAIKKARDEKEEIATTKAHHESNLAHIEEQQALIDRECRERYNTSASSLVIPEEQQTLDLASLEETVKKLRSNCEKNQHINFAAEQEYEEVSKRRQFLEEQLQDLTQAKEELTLLIERLEVDAKKVFEEKFLLIKEAFQKNFSILFNGGEADLELEKDKDILDAGIEILAKPPGKQMRSLALLSGGEKCLTTIALLFALFEVRPAPFCILDEIDAPLDEINVGRFGKLLKSFAEKCQFLVITHNKQTMAIADVLVGVSMQEKGVSQLVSLDFKKLSQKEVNSIA